MSVHELEEECNRLRHSLTSHEQLQTEVEVLRQELDTSLETHKKLQQVSVCQDLTANEWSTCEQTPYWLRLPSMCLACVQNKNEIEMSSAQMSVIVFVRGFAQ